MRGWILESTEEPAITIRLTSNSTKTIGRTPAADFVLDAPLLSRVHCRLTADASDQLVLEDLGSTNGTYVNGEKATRAVLREGDRLRLGRLEFNVSRPPPR
jgi:pSer/pThr/pTyr-binding forkhead associated (FHA) protein